MAKIRIKIEDLPKDQKISDDEMKKVIGGTTFRITTDEPSRIIRQPNPFPPPPIVIVS